MLARQNAPVDLCHGTGECAWTIHIDQAGAIRPTLSVSQGVRSMARITVIGGGYVGLVTSACFAGLGHQARCLESDAAKVDSLRSGAMPIQEPGLAEMWARHSESGNLSITADPAEALSLTSFIYIAVGTPESPDGSADLSYLREAVHTAQHYSDLSRIVCIKSTVPPGTCAGLQSDLNKDARPEDRWTVVSNPEFLSQGRAVQDFMNPDRIVVGSSDAGISQMVAGLYFPLDAPIVSVDSAAAETVKYASNSFLALKISFINEISRLCEHTGTDIGQVATGVGLDSRIGPRFLEAGIGWGGSCFPKDTAALEHFMRSAGLESQVVSAARAVNRGQVEHIADQLVRMVGAGFGKEIAMLGLTFKDGTDDLRGSQVLPLINRLSADGFSIRVFDPSRPVLRNESLPPVTVCDSPQEALFGASGAVLATAWPELVSLDYASARHLMREPVLIDARRALDPGKLKALGYRYARPGDGRTAPHLAQRPELTGTLSAA